MPDCRHCDRSFDDEATYVAHLQEAHPEDIGPIDRRRIESLESDGRDWSVPTGPATILGALLVTGAIVGFGYLALDGSGGADQQGPVHFHGSVTVVVYGQQVDLGPGGTEPFHIHSGEPGRFHVEARPVPTLEKGMAALGVEVTQGSVTVNGQTYRDSAADTEVVVTVDGEPVDPSSYTVERGDTIRIVVRKA